MKFGRVLLILGTVMHSFPTSFQLISQRIHSHFHIHLLFDCFFFAAAALAVTVIAKDEEPEKLGTVIGIDLGTFVPSSGVCIHLITPPSF